MRRLFLVSHPLPVICGLLVFGTFIWGLIYFPASSHAAFQQVKEKEDDRPLYVPGEILVRFREESTAKLRSQSELSIEANGRQATIRLERLTTGAEAVPGLRIAHVKPDDTMAAIEALRLRSDVIYAEPNYILRKLQLPNDPRFN